VEPSFVPSVVDAMVCVPDAASIAAMRWCSSVTGRLVGGSTGTAMWGALRLVASMRSAGEAGSVVTLLCDGGDRYAHTYYDDVWLAAQGIDIAPYTATLEKFYDTGAWSEPSPTQS
jgi:cysteine synthase